MRVEEPLVRSGARVTAGLAYPTKGRAQRRKERNNEPW
jgi:hypothetical protein